MDQTSRMVRRQPALFIGGAVAAGFLLSRFLKSSEHHESSGGYESRSGYSGQGMPHVTSAHVDPDEILPGRAMPPVTPTGRRDY